MAESWVRLWAGMTTDPKWKTIARKSGRPLCEVIALFTHTMMLANESECRGSIDETWNTEDVASALDMDEEHVQSIRDAMEGRVIVEGCLTGWEKRQVFREESGNAERGAKSNTQRSREFRDRQRQVQRDETQRNVPQRDETQCNAPEAEAEAEADIKPKGKTAGSGAPPPFPPSEIQPTRKGVVCGLLRKAGMADAAPHYLADEVWDSILSRRSDEEIVEVARAKMALRPGQRTGLKYIAQALLDDPPPMTNARASPRRNIHDERAETIAFLTGKSRNERPDERDITGESCRIG